MDRPICRVVSSEYLDKDVYLNIRAFYRAAGFRLIPPTARLNGVTAHQADLLVVLRGDNGSDLQDFSGPIHVYDYVKEYVVDWARRYPAASQITVVALAASSSHSVGDSESASDSSRLSWVDAYLPVIPALWTLPWSGKHQQPVHI